jgi:hypothetical protein
MHLTFSVKFITLIRVSWYTQIIIEQINYPVPITEINRHLQEEKWHNIN